MNASQGLVVDKAGVVWSTPANLVANRIYIGKNKPYSFEDRPLMAQIFDDPHQQILLKTSRQISKCVDENAPILMGDGSWKPAVDIRVGDVVATMNSTSGANIGVERIVWVSGRTFKQGYRVRTRLGHTLDLGAEHPVRVWGDWRKTHELKVGDRIASVRALPGCFYGDADISDERVRLTSKLIGDGYICHAAVDFTQLPGPSLEEFKMDLLAVGTTFGVSAKQKTTAVAVRAHRDGPLRDWLLADGLMGTKSETKFLPAWVFRLDRRQSSMFLNRLWSTDGMVKKPKPSQYQISYCTTSRRLAGDVQSMLWKFGIQTSIKEHTTAATLANGTTLPGLNAFIVRVETQDGVRRFLSDVGAMGKSESIDPPTAKSNNNRDTFPIGINADIEAVSVSAGFQGKKGVLHDGTSLHSAGLSRTPSHPLTAGKLTRYVDHFRSMPDRYNQKAVEAIAAHADGDIAWDEITSIEQIGDIPCVDFEVATHHNFIVDGVVTHNSTTIGGRILINTEIHAPYTALFLSPTYAQTANFSHQRLGPTVKQSPHLQIRMDEDCLDNVLQKEFIDGSLIYLSYAKDNADRVRGISVDEINFDEVQDMLLDVVEPVVRESLFTSPYKRRFYSGTPKSMQNGIETLWKNSDQRMWMVACRRHSPVFYQPLMPTNVGKHGPICTKCKKLLNTLDGVWAITNTMNADGKKPFVHGYHIPQMVFPTTTTLLPSGKRGFLDWAGFIRDIEDPMADEATVLNEKFGLSADSAAKPISEELLRSLCNSEFELPREFQQRFLGTSLYAGVDWGLGQGSSTVLTIGQFDPENPARFRIVYVKRFDGKDADPETCRPEIVRLCRHFRVKRLHADWGGGAGINSTIMAEEGEDFITTNYWSNGMSAALSNFDQRLNRFVLNRSITITKFFQALKRGGISINFRWEDYKPISVDLLNVFREERKNGDVFYSHNDGTQDDAMHSHIYCWLVACWDRDSVDFVREAKAQGYIHNPSVI